MHLPMGKENVSFQKVVRFASRDCFNPAQKVRPYPQAAKLLCTTNHARWTVQRTNHHIWLHAYTV